MLSELWQSVRGRAVTPSVAVTFSLGEIDEDDADIDSGDEAVPTWSDTLQPIAGFACVIVYRDTRGRDTQRLITCQRKDSHGTDHYLWAYCHARGAIRQFKIDRIIDVFDAQTGEAYGAAEFFDRFNIDREHATKPGWGLGVQQRSDLSALLNALVFIAKCDRVYHALEIGVIEEVIARYWLRFEAPGEPDQEGLMRYVDRLAPDSETFFVSLNRCVGKPKLARLLRESAQAVVDADGRLAPEEVFWGSKIDEYIARSG